MIDLIQTRRKTNQLLERRRQTASVVERESSELDLLASLIEALREAQEIVQGVAQTVQQQVHQRIAKIVSRCLNAVFDEPYEFKIRFDRKRGKTEAQLVFSRDGAELDDPLNSIGGGVIDVASLGLRLACLLLTRPALRRLIILDEPFKNVRGDVFKARTRRMMERLAEDLGIQFVVNTDFKEYQLGPIIEL